MLICALIISRFHPTVVRCCDLIASLNRSSLSMRLLTVFCWLLYSQADPARYRPGRLAPTCFWLHNVMKRGICYERDCPSVCLSQSWVAPKRFKISKYATVCTIWQTNVIIFLRQNSPSPISGFTPNECVKERHLHVDTENLTIRNIFKTVQDRK